MRVLLVNKFCGMCHEIYVINAYICTRKTYQQTWVSSVVLVIMRIFDNKDAAMHG